MLPYDEGQAYRFSAPDFFGAKHIPPVLVKAMMPADLWNSCLKFAFFRNPYDWVVSTWFHNFQLKVPQGIPRSLTLIFRLKNRLITANRRVDGIKYRELYRRKVLQPEDIRFLWKYLREHYKTLPYKDRKLQTAYLLDADGNKLLDFVGRFEKLSDDFASIMREVGLPVKLPHLNASCHSDYRSYFTKESANLVYQLWREDFQALGYSKNLNSC